MPTTFEGRAFFVIQSKCFKQVEGGDTFESGRNDIVLASNIIEAIKHVTLQLDTADGIDNFEVVGALLNQPGQEVMIADDGEFLGDY